MTPIRTPGDAGVNSTDALPEGPPGRPIVAVVDTALLIAGGIAAAAIVTAVASVLHVRKLSAAVDHALDRIGTEPAGRWWRRPAALRRVVRDLEDRVASSERDRARLAAHGLTGPERMLEGAQYNPCSNHKN